MALLTSSPDPAIQQLDLWEARPTKWAVKWPCLFDLRTGQDKLFPQAIFFDLATGNKSINLPRSAPHQECLFSYNTWDFQRQMFYTPSNLHSEMIFPPMQSKHVHKAKYTRSVSRSSFIIIIVTYHYLLRLLNQTSVKVRQQNQKTLLLLRSIASTASPILI